MVFGTNETLHDENKQTNTKEIINIFFIKNSLKHSIMQKKNKTSKSDIFCRFFIKGTLKNFIFKSIRNRKKCSII